jgi:hypothetical protein
MADSDVRTDFRQWATKKWADRQQQDIDSIRDTGRPYNPGVLESAWLGMSNYPLNMMVKAADYMDPEMKGHGDTGEAAQIRNQLKLQAIQNAKDQYNNEQYPKDASGWGAVRQGIYPVKDKKWGQ